MEKTTFTISFDSNGGTLTGDAQVEAEKDQRLELPSVTQKNYVFCGWYDGDNKWNVLDTVSKSVTLTARWLPKTANGGKITVKFDANDGKKNIIAEIQVNTDKFVPNDAVPETPVREGYYFAGWHTRDSVTESDLVGGVSKYLYLTGQSKGAAGFWHSMKSIFYPASEIESLTDDGTATLYARWVQLKEISDEQQLSAMRDDLYGAYKLTADITLTEDWHPVGSYYSHYELFETPWWIHAFRGSFDGNGHTIRGMEMTSVAAQLEDGINAFVNEGEYGVTVLGLFGSVVKNAVIKDFTIDGCNINLKADQGCYVGVVAGFMMGGTIQNVDAVSSDIDVTANDGGYLSVTGFVGGFWEGRIKNCFASGELKFTANRKNDNTGDIFVGGISGECYSFVEDCESDYTIQVIVNDQSTPIEDGHLQVNVGGLNGANCYLTGGKTNADISVKILDSQGKVTVRAGLAAGIERYGYIRDCETAGSIAVESPESGDIAVYQGSILGGFDNSTFALIGAMFDPALKIRYVTGCTTTDAVNGFVGEPYADNQSFTYQVTNNSVING